MNISKPWQYSLIFGTLITILGCSFSLIKEHIVLKTTVEIQGEQLKRIESTVVATKSQVDVLNGMVTEILRSQRASQQISLSHNYSCDKCSKNA